MLRGALLLIGVAGCSLPSRPEPVIDPVLGHWRDGFHLPGLTGHAIEDVAIGQDGSVLVAGSGVVGDLSGSFLRWDGIQWHGFPTTHAGNRIAISNGVVYATSSLIGPLEDGPVPEISYLLNDQWVPVASGPATRMISVPDGVVAVGETIGVVHVDQTGSVILGNVSGAAALARSGTTICIGGSFQAVDSVAAMNVACLENGTWAQAGDGIPGGVRALAFDSLGRLVAGGSFSLPDGANLAILEGTQWRAVGGGVDGADAVVEALATNGTEIMIGGRFSRVGGAIAAENLARYNGASWFVPASGGVRTATEVDPSYSYPVVLDLEVASDGSTYVVGRFFVAGGQAAANVARWSGDQLHPLIDAAETPMGIGGTVRAFVRDSDGNLVAGGDFITAGTEVVRHVAKLRDGVWEPMGDPGGVIDALLVNNGRVLAVGTMPGIVGWNGSTWEPGGPDVNGRIRTIATHNNRIVIGGDFTSAGTVGVSYVVAVGPLGFSPIGGGLPGPVRVLATDTHGKLCAGLVDGPPNPLWCWDGSAWNAEALRGRSVAAIAVVPRNGYEELLVAGDLDHRPVDQQAFAARLTLDGWETFQNFENYNLDGYAIVPYGGGAFIGAYFNCCQGAVLWWNDQPDPHAYEARYPSLIGGADADTSAPLALSVDADTLYVGATVRWRTAEGESGRIAAGIGAWELPSQ